MTLGRRLLRFLYPQQEAQRMAMRRMMAEVEACAEDMIRTVRSVQKPDLDKFRHPKKANGALK